MSTSSDTPKEEIDQLYATLQQRFSTGVTRSLGWRLYNLKQLAWMIEDNRKAIHEAVKTDLGGGGFSVDMSDLFPIINEIDLAVKRLPKWVKDESRVADSMLSFKSMSPIIKKQPKGVVLIISPWNYPWQLTFGPLVAAIAAGCPAIIKPSESSSASSALMARLVPLYLDTQAYGIVLGAAEVSTHLLKKPWGHVMYTGSDRVGKIVAKAAADTLTPSTLELGGKSPVIITKDADLHKAARRMFSIKQLTTGQMCVTPDHVLVEKEVVDEFIRISKETLDAFYPPSPNPGSLLHCGMASHFMTEQSYARQVGFVEKAEEQGKLVYKGEMDASTRRMGFSLVKLAEDGVGETGGLVEEEIFGAVVPIIPVSSLDKAIEWINARPHPLALYVCSSKQSTFDTVVERTTSGSATWNDFGFATLARSMPFGGVGGSGCKWFER